MAAAVAPSPPEGLKKIGLHRWVDVVLHFPLRYENESQVVTLADVVPGQFAQVQVQVVSSRVVFRPRRMLLVEVEDATGSAMLRFIYFKEAQKNAYRPGLQFRVLGEARRSLAGLEFIHPRMRLGWCDPSTLQEQPMVAVYPTAAGLPQATLRRAVKAALSQALPQEWLPPELLASYRLMPLPDAIRLLHAPPVSHDRTSAVQEHDAPQERAWNRIRFDELMAQQLLLRRARALRQHERSMVLTAAERAEQLMRALPFALTAAQQRVWNEISRDLARDRPMQRLLQGDVGSGKTAVAALAAAQAAGSNAQVAVMAPTEILAEQLFAKFKDYLSPLGLSVVFLKGGLGKAERTQRLQSIASGDALVVVGTHALIQKDVDFHGLGLVIVDEQHRFGVGQRLVLRARGSDGAAHLLARSATPIPRSLAMTYMADLDVSVLDERPPNRQPIVTKLMASARRDELAHSLHDFLAQGGQAYWVCPVIDSARAEGERELQAIESAAAWLAPQFGDALVVLHGRMPAEEKQAAMSSFARGEKRLMLATTVIEVGVDVPNATLMVIEHAERFGLAQLHQLRGRIGRGGGHSTCILLFDEPLSETAKERLKTLYETSDGFEVARRDLAIRGPGEFLGLRQSGIPTLRYCDLERDAVWVERAVAFGAKCAAAGASPSQLAALGVTVEALERLVDRWAAGKENVLASG